MIPPRCSTGPHRHCYEYATIKIYLPRYYAGRHFIEADRHATPSLLEYAGAAWPPRRHAVIYDSPFTPVTLDTIFALLMFIISAAVIDIGHGQRRHGCRLYAFISLEYFEGGCRHFPRRRDTLPLCHTLSPLPLRQRRVFRYSIFAICGDTLHTLSSFPFITIIYSRFLHAVTRLFMLRLTPLQMPMAAITPLTFMPHILAEGRVLPPRRIRH